MLCIQRTQPSSVVLPGSIVVPQTGSPPGLREKSGQLPRQPQRCVNSEGVSNHENSLPVSSTMSSPTLTTPLSVITTTTVNKIIPAIESSGPAVHDSDIAVTSSQPDAQPCELEVQSPSVSSQRRSENDVDGGIIQTDSSIQPEDFVMSNPVPPTDDQSEKTAETLNSDVVRPKQRVGEVPVKIRSRHGARSSAAVPRTRTPNRTTGKISVFMKGRLQRTGTLRTGGSSSQTSKSSPIMASRAPPVLPRLKSDDKLHVDVSQAIGNEQIGQSGQSTQQAVTVMSPSKTQGDSSSHGTSQMNRSITMKPVQTGQSSASIKKEPHSPSPYEQQVVDASMDVSEPDELDEEEPDELERVTYEESSQQTMSMSSDFKSVQEKGDDLTDMSSGSQLAAMEAMVKSACPSSKGAYVQSGSECAEEARIVRAKFTWRPEKPLTLEMLQNMSREKGLSGSSTPKGSQSLPEVPALSKSRSISGGDLSSSEITRQTGKQSIDRYVRGLGFEHECLVRFRLLEFLKELGAF